MFYDALLVGQSMCTHSAFKFICFLRFHQRFGGSFSICIKGGMDFDMAYIGPRVLRTLLKPCMSLGNAHLFVKISWELDI